VDPVPSIDPSMHDRATFRIADHVRASSSEDGLVLLDVLGGIVLSSNPIGARIWQLIAERVCCVDIAVQLTRDYDVPLDRARRDVAAFVSSLEQRRLIHPEPSW